MRAGAVRRRDSIGPRRTADDGRTLRVRPAVGPIPTVEPAPAVDPASAVGLGHTVRPVAPPQPVGIGITGARAG